MHTFSNRTSSWTAQRTVIQTTHLREQLNLQPFKQHNHLHEQLNVQPFKQHIFMNSSTHNHSNNTSSWTAQRTPIQTTHLYEQRTTIQTAPLHAQLDIQPLKRHIFMHNSTYNIETTHLCAQLNVQPFKQYIFMHSSTFNHLNNTSSQSCTAQTTIF